jgi:alkylhydroperoxidase family enzyme
MGHGNMLLAVAGLKDDEIKQRTKKLAAGDWDAFAPAERQAYAFAARLSSRPAAVTAADVKDLVDTFGPERAVDVIWYSAWVNFMTRVADSFQFPLERENVFAGPPPAKAKGEGPAPKP